MKTNKLSLLFPDQDRVVYQMIPEETWHDPGMDALTEKLSAQPQERAMIAQVMRGMTADPSVAAFRCGVFGDILRHPKIREKLVAETRDGKNSFRVRIAPPEGKSFAREIAEKYGVMYEELTGEMKP